MVIYGLFWIISNTKEEDDFLILKKIIPMAADGNATAAEKFACKLHPEWMPPDYEEVVAEKCLKVSFKPDIFQKQAFYFISQNKNVFVAAHTSSGKTLVAEYAISVAQGHGSRIIYTSPIKALSNQKFYDFKQKYDNVGIITGDVQVNPTADCLIMTTEILRNLVYKNSDILRDTEYVIFDEVHYINDEERGVVWEEAIIMLPKHITIIMLSATIPNAMEFSEWVGRTRKTPVYVISTFKRAVPLEFLLYCNSDVYSLFEPKKGEVPPSNLKTKPAMLPKNMYSLKPFKIMELGHYVINRRLVPAIFFSFSKKSCEEYGQALHNLDTTTPQEKKRIGEFISGALSNLSECDRFLPQILKMTEQAHRGIAVHHSGLLPFVKECIEILFSCNLIKILVATETFAMGVNMPAMCCVFTGLTKIDGGSFRMLTAGEFIQMSGRAGRRGMDKVGTVLIATQKMQMVEQIKKLITGIPYDLKSKFRLSFNLILTGIRSNVVIEDLLRSSFKEHFAQKKMPEDMEMLRALEKIQPLSCEMCKDISLFLTNLRSLISSMQQLIPKVLKVNDLAVLRDNNYGRVKKIEGNKIEIEYLNEPLNDILFNRKNDVESSNTTDSSQMSVRDSLYPVLPPTLMGTETGFKGYEKKDIIFISKNGKLDLNLQLSEVYDVNLLLLAQKAYQTLSECSCLRCESLSTHYYNGIYDLEIAERKEKIKSQYSLDSLIQINEYLARMKYLEDMGFIENKTITMKGRAAAEIRTVDDILVTEMAFGNKFNDYTPAELMAIFSAMIAEDCTEEEYELYESFREKAKDFNEEHSAMSAALCASEVPLQKPLEFSMSNAVYDWCEGKSLGVIASAHKIQEGSFVRLILRLDECCREMLNFCNVIGDEVLENKFSSASQIIKRDIIFMPSLYMK
ncbi:antiviral helicase SKI2 [Enteropsectra breve]|nr:antiviral helicase SKI2 [Enteropsectra breve]